MSVKEIAKRANVSIGTVDRVIHNRGRVSPETKIKIKKIIKEINYKPNIFAKNLSLGKTYRFGVFMPKLTQDSNYWQLPDKGINKAQAELIKYKVEMNYFYYDRYSELSFKNSFNNLMKQKLDGILIAPVLTSAATQMIKTIPENIPYVFFDSTLPEANCLSAIGQDSFQSGILAAKLMQMMVKEKGCIAAVKILPEDFHINERLRGFQTLLNNRNDLNMKIYEADSNKSQKEFNKLSEKILCENKNLKGIFISNAWTYPFAEYFSSLTECKNVFIIGYDLIQKNIRHLRDGSIHFIISQRPEMQGYEGIYTLFRHIVLKEKVKNKTLIPLDILTKENLEYYQD